MRRWRSAALCAMSMLACGGSGESFDADQTGQFVAFSEDFRGYHDWYNAESETVDPLIATLHKGFEVTETQYISQTPKPGSKEFPVGTLIVKEALASDGTSTVFARVKRGGKFNVKAGGWEWFELENLEDGKDGVYIVWHGLGPPAGEKYGGDPDGCNGCHKACADNDLVCSGAFDLSKF